MGEQHIETLKNRRKNCKWFLLKLIVISMAILETKTNLLNSHYRQLTAETPKFHVYTRNTVYII